MVACKEYRQLASLVEDIRYALRLLARQRAFTATAIFLLALGIGVNGAIFSVVDTVLLHPLPYPEPERLYNLWTRNLPREVQQSAVSAPEFVQYAAHTKSFSHCAAFTYQTVTLTGQGLPAHVSASLVSPQYLDMLGMRVVLGRGFAAEEFEEGRNQVALLSDGYWKSRFGGDPSILGKTIRLDDEIHVVAGVLAAMPAQSRGVDVYIPLFFNAKTMGAWDSRFLYVQARLRDGATPRQAEAELSSIAARLAQERPDRNAGVEAFLVPAVQDAQGESRHPLMMLSAAVGIILLITCANLANLLLIRSAARQREVAIRSAMGASQGRVFVQMITESLTLAVLGGAAGLVVAWWSLRAIARFAPAGMARLQDATINYEVLGFTFAVSLVAGLLFGAVPAAQVLRLNLASALRDEARGSSGGVRRSLVRSIFVISQVALSVILLIGAGLLLRTFAAISRIDTGFRADHVVTMRATLPEARYRGEEAAAAYVRRAIRQLEATPGVVSAGTTTSLPMMQINWRANFTVDGQPVQGGERETASYNAISPRYLETIGAVLIKGRQFSETDTAATDPVILVSQAFVRRYFAGQDPLGQMLRMQVGVFNFHARIVGVVGDIAQLRPDEPPRVAIYQPHAQCAWPFLAFAVRTTIDQGAVVEAMRRAFYEVDPNLPLARVMPLGQLLSQVLAERQMATTLLLLFAALAVVLAGVGLYGVLAVAVAQRSREIGIRMALGAGRGDIVRLILAHGLALTAAGLAAGLVAAPLAGSVFKQMLYGVEPLDPLTLAGAALITLIAALAASIYPAWRAARLDPATSLRTE